MAYSSYSRRGGLSTLTKIGIAVAVVLVLALVGSCAVSYYKDDPVTITITGKESVNTHDGHKYRIYTTGETYVMHDTLIKGRFNTATEYGHLVTGHRYACKAYGIRSGLGSHFKNLHDCRDLTP